MKLYITDNGKLVTGITSEYHKQEFLKYNPRITLTETSMEELNELLNTSLKELEKSISAHITDELRSDLEKLESILTINKNITR